MSQTDFAFKQNQQDINNIEEFRFEPIKGFPMLNWKGKRPFYATQFYPAQLKETHGQATNNWLNKIFWGDNLQVMSHLLKNYRGQVDLIYIDPPFDSKADYKKKIQLKGQSITNDSTTFEEKQYTDIWSNDEYLQFMYERFILIRELLSEKGSFFLHCDWRKVHYLKIILDEVFGKDNSLGHIIWRSMTSSGFKGKTSLGKSHDDILYFCKNANNFVYNSVIIPYSESYIKERFSKKDDNGRLFKDEKIGTATTDKRYQELLNEGKIYFTSNGTPRIKHYLDEASGYPADDVWTDISGENSQSKNLTNYPTQKPEDLLKRVIEIASNPNDLIFDCFMGSGTTQAVAMKLGRRFIGADINLGAIQTTTKRLLKIARELNGTIQDSQKYTGFEVYNVNHYDIFRNPLEAKELLIKALEIEPFDASNLYDGEKDGRLVKIMPINRIATRADLNELITGFDYKAFERRHQATSTKPVEHILLVCMGHEPDLAAHLKEQIKAAGYLIDVEVVDILRDKSNLEFKRDSEAEITVENDQIFIRDFYPMNLLQKLSLMKEDVTDWRELVESIMIDFNYDGSVFEPSIVDVPAGAAIVIGVYHIPKNAGKIRVKITDVLSESLEMTV